MKLPFYIIIFIQTKINGLDSFFLFFFGVRKFLDLKKLTFCEECWCLGLVATDWVRSGGRGWMSRGSRGNCYKEHDPAV